MIAGTAPDDMNAMESVTADVETVISPELVLLSEPLELLLESDDDDESESEDEEESESDELELSCLRLFRGAEALCSLG